MGPQDAFYAIIVLIDLPGPKVGLYEYKLYAVSRL